MLLKFAWCLGWCKITLHTLQHSLSSHILEVPMELLFIRLIVWDYSYRTFLFCQLYTQGCHGRVSNMACCSSGWREFLIPAVLYVTGHTNPVSWTIYGTESLNIDFLPLLTFFQPTGHTVNTEPQMGFGFRDPKIQVCWEQGFCVHFLRGFASFFMVVLCADWKNWYLSKTRWPSI